MKCFGGLCEFGLTEINCWAKMHVGNTDCMNSFEKVASVFTDACSNRKKNCN